VRAMYPGPVPNPSVRLGLVPGGGPARDAAGVVGAEERVVVVTPRRDPLERRGLGELEVQRAATRAVGGRWRRRVHGVAVVEGEVSGLGLERDDRELALLTPGEP